MISTHILDTSVGNPAANVAVELEFNAGDGWKSIETGETNQDGRYKFEKADQAGQYRITFKIEDYLRDSFFLNTPVAFNVKDTGRNYHVPLLLNPYGYSTYRGS